MEIKVYLQIKIYLENNINLIDKHDIIYSFLLILINIYHIIISINYINLSSFKIFHNCEQFVNCWCIWG